ncbi:MAG: hypothetical protein AWU59_950 [Methanolobus sp. T82-4]|jgi:hypothetical protein|nr:MAG: hypothetical protein AWU59_950 [Methanolobus sp. T82-4]
MAFAPEYAIHIQFWVWMTFLTIFSSIAIIWLGVENGDKYSKEDSNAHAEEFGGVIAESHGPITNFLWVIYVILTIWTIAYFWLHWSEFSSLSM